MNKLVPMVFYGFLVFSVLLGVVCYITPLALLSLLGMIWIISRQKQQTWVEMGGLFGGAGHLNQPQVTTVRWKALGQRQILPILWRLRGFFGSREGWYI